MNAAWVTMHGRGQQVPTTQVSRLGVLDSRIRPRPSSSKTTSWIECDDEHERQARWVGAWKVLLLVMGLVIVPWAACAQPVQLPHNIGIEGEATHDLSRSDYRPRPLDDRTELILRIGSIETISNGLHRYHFHYMGLEPGDYSLAEYLILPDGSRPTELEEVRLRVRPTLPEDHDGVLTPLVPGAFPFIGGYRVFLGLLGLLWLGGIVGFAVSFRTRRPVQTPVRSVPQPTFAERLEPLVEAAAAGTLSADDKALMERLLMGYWRERLDLPKLRMVEALARLKAHAQAGELLRAVERWLHQPNGAPLQSEVNRLLKPYRPGPQPLGTGAAP